MRSIDPARAWISASANGLARKSSAPTGYARLEVGFGRDEDDGDELLRGTHLDDAQHLQPVHVGQHHVEQDEVRGVRHDVPQGPPPVVRHDDLVPLVREGLLQPVGLCGRVLDHQHARGGHHVRAQPGVVTGTRQSCR